MRARAVAWGLEEGAGKEEVLEGGDGGEEGKKDRRHVTRSNGH